MVMSTRHRTSNTRHTANQTRRMVKRYPNRINIFYPVGRRAEQDRLGKVTQWLAIAILEEPTRQNVEPSVIPKIKQKGGHQCSFKNFGTYLGICGTTATRNFTQAASNNNKHFIWQLTNRYNGI